MTTFSPSTVGRVASLMSSRRPTAAVESVMRPSCGFRRSAMSSLARTLSRVVTPADIRFEIRCTSRRTPSTRKRTTSASSCGSKWTSEAPSSAAWKISELTRRTSGPSEMPSSASRSSPGSSSSSASASSSAVPTASAARTSFCSSTTMSSRGADRELERVLRRETELVDRVQVSGIGDDDLEHVVLEGVRNRDRALERVHGDELRRVGRDADRRDVDERKVVPGGEHPGDAVRRRRRPPRSARR